MVRGAASWRSYVTYDEQQAPPDIDRALLRRVIGYAKPYRGLLALVLGTVVIDALLGLIPPLLMRSLIDTAIPAGDLGLVTWLGIGMVAVPLVAGAVVVVQRHWTASMGQGIVYDLRRQLFGHVQQMSLGFFTNTRTGELMSRLNTDVQGAQQAVTSSFLSVVAAFITASTTLIVMLRLEWRLTLLSVAILPLFILSSRKVGKRLRVLRRAQMEENAGLSSIMQETLSVSGAMLSKLFGRTTDENQRFSGQAATVRDLAVRQATIARWFFMTLGIVRALGTALVFWVGALMVIRGSLTIGTIVALSAYLGRLYGPLSQLANARVEFAQSLVSFERVFELLDMPSAIKEKPHPECIESFEGRVEFDDVWFSYAEFGGEGLESVRRFGRGGEATIAQLELSRRERTVAVEIRMAMAQLDTSLAAVVQAERRLDVARENASEVRLRFRSGLASALEQADAAANEFEAGIVLERQRFLVERARLALREAVGRWPQ